MSQEARDDRTTGQSPQTRDRDAEQRRAAQREAQLGTRAGDRPRADDEADVEAEYDARIAETETGTDGDAWITTRVNADLAADDEVSAFDIDVETDHGVVHLSGDVDEQSHLNRAVAIAHDVRGVVRVDVSGLRVDGVPGGEPAEGHVTREPAQQRDTRQQRDTQQQRDTPPQRDRDATTRERTEGAQRDTDPGAGEVAGDAWITTKINSQLAVDGDVSVFDISVETRNNVVHLTGEVESEYQRRAAMEIARDTEGVERVDATGLYVGVPGDEGHQTAGWERDD